MTRQKAASKSVRSHLSVRLAAWLALTALALALAWLAWGYNLERACTLRQWPELASCASLVGDAAAQAQALRERIARNPGDSEAWIQLAVLASQPDPVAGLNPDAALDTATQLAGQDNRVQRLQAARAMIRQQWPQAVGWLVRLVQDAGDGRAALALAGLVAQPQALAAMQNQLQPGTRWLEPVINAMPQAGVPVVAAMPLVVRALPQQGVSPALALRLLRGFKADGQWLEAHALWTAWLGHPVPLLFNGDFEHGFIADGFDWDVTPAPPSKAGALVGQVTASGHGGVLEIEFSGKPVVQPVLRQHLVLLGNHYVFQGQFMANRLNVKEGLTWALLCATDGREVARTPVLKETGGEWRPFMIEFELRPGCGPAVSLQLQTVAPYEALTGLRGQVMFDNFKLEEKM